MKVMLVLLILLGLSAQQVYAGGGVDDDTQQTGGVAWMDGAANPRFKYRLTTAGSTPARQQPLPRFNKLWTASAISVSAANGLDLGSSYGRPGFERNPVFGQTVTGPDAALKIGGVTGILLLQRYVIRKYPRSKAARAFALVNFGVTAWYTRTAIRNWSIP